MAGVVCCMQFSQLLLHWLRQVMGIHGYSKVENICVFITVMTHVILSLNDVNGNVNSSTYHPVPDAPLSDDIISWIVSLPPLLALIGSLLSSLLLNYLGRKNSIILSGFIFLTSFLMIGLADLITISETMILAGRALSGLGVGLGVPSTSIYIAECSSPVMRGRLSSLPAFLLALGVLLGYVFGKKRF